MIRGAAAAQFVAAVLVLVAASAAADAQSDLAAALAGVVVQQEVPSLRHSFVETDSQQNVRFPQHLAASIRRHA